MLTSLKKNVYLQYAKGLLMEKNITFAAKAMPKNSKEKDEKQRICLIRF